MVVLESLWQQSRLKRKSFGKSAKILVIGQRTLSKLRQAHVHSRIERSAGANSYMGLANDLAILNKQSREELRGLIERMEGEARYKDEVAKLSRYVETTGDTNSILEEELERFLTAEEAGMNAEGESFKKSEQNIHQLIAVGLSLSLITRFLLILVFTQSIANRLRIVIANSERFAQNKELKPLAPGNDEIDHLDRVFREMTESVRNSRQREHQFLGMVSHDLRTPLNTVLAVLNSLSEGNYGKLTESGTERVRQAEAAVERLTRLTHDLLDLEKLSSGTLLLSLTPVELRHAIDTAIGNVEGYYEFKKIKVQRPTTDLVVMADEAKLVQVLVNLLSNAIKFSPDSGTVGIAVRMLQTNSVEIRVTDQGCGIPLSEQNAIFEPFRRAATDEKLDGTGLGLSICKSIIDAHGGSIGLESKPGGGSTFYIRVRKAQAVATII